MIKGVPKERKHEVDTVQVMKLEVRKSALRAARGQLAHLIERTEREVLFMRLRIMRAKC